MSKKIVIIGAGSIGSRHLQAIKKVNIKIEIYVLDKSDASLKVAKSRYMEIKSNNNISKIVFTNKISDLPKSIYLLISATTASVRYVSTKSILDLCVVKFIIFEKFLFSKVQEVNKMRQILKDNNIKAWVNCNYQTIPFFKNNEYFNSTKLSMIVHGGNWAFASSAIHFIELFCYLTKEKISEIEFDLLGEKVLVSKRSKYHEFGGTLTAKTKGGDFLVIESKKDSKKPLYLDLSNSDYLFRLEISKRIASLTDFKKKDSQTKSFKLKFPMQSELSNLYLEEIVKKKNCGLPTYQDCSINHISLIKLFKNKLSKDQRYKKRKDIVFT